MRARGYAIDLMSPFRTGLLALVASVVACGNATPAPVALPPTGSTASSALAPLVLGGPPDEPMPHLRTGALRTVEVSGEASLKLVGRHVGEGYEVLEAELPGDFTTSTVAVDVQAGQPSPLAFVSGPSSSSNQRNGQPVVWVRRPVSDPPVTGELFAYASSSTPGKHQHFRIADPRARPSWPTPAAWDRRPRV